ncbi:MAG: hypothetical protein ACMUEM_04770 [Flavobacteriales bacterium AspAUS03]
MIQKLLVYDLKDKRLYLLKGVSLRESEDTFPSIGFTEDKKVGSFRGGSCKPSG